MPQLTFAVTPAGLAVPVWVGLGGKATTSLQVAGQPIPRPVQARGVLDTGASATAVAPWVLRRLAIPLAATASSQTAGGLVSVNLHDVSLSITDPAQPAGSTLTCSDLLVSELTTVLPDVDVLIGLDVLLECRMLLDGPARQFTLDF